MLPKVRFYKNIREKLYLNMRKRRWIMNREEQRIKCKNCKQEMKKSIQRQVYIMLQKEKEKLQSTLFRKYISLAVAGTLLAVEDVIGLKKEDTIKILPRINNVLGECIDKKKTQNYLICMLYVKKN